MKKALITGSGGFIGQHLIKVLKAQSFEVIEFSQKNGQDITKKDDLLKIDSVDYVFHLAAVSGYKTSNQDVSLAYKVNVLGTVNVLEYCKQNLAKLIFPSTYVYDQPYTEIKKETDPVKPTTHYSMTKWLGEELCRFYARVFKVNSLILRTANVFGLGQEDIYIVPVVLNHIIKAQALELTKPEVERSFIYIDDLIKAYVKLALAETKPGEVFNVGPRHPTSLKQLVKTIETVTGKKGKVRFSGKDRPYEVDKNRVNINKLKSKLDWQPEIDLKTGLRKMIQVSQ